MENLETPMELDSWEFSEAPENYSPSFNYDCSQISLWIKEEFSRVYRELDSFFCVIGIILNIFAFVVFMGRHMRSQVIYIIFIGVAYADIGGAFSVLMLHICHFTGIDMLDTHTYTEGRFWLSSIDLTATFWQISNLLPIVLFLVCIIEMCFNQKCCKYIAPKTMLICLVIVYILSIVFSIPHYLLFQLRPTENGMYKVEFNWNLELFLVSDILPHVVLCISVVLASITVLLVAIQKWRNTYPRRFCNKSSLLGILVLFITTHSFYIILHLMSYFSNNDCRFVFHEINSFLMSIYSSGKFVIYCCTDPLFKNSCLELIMSKICRKSWTAMNEDTQTDEGHPGNVERTSAV